MAKANPLFWLDLRGDSTKWHDNDKQLFMNHCERLRRKKPGMYGVSIIEIKEKHTQKQQGMYWVILSYIEKATGMDQEGIHSAFMEKCGFGDWNTIMDKEKFFRYSSSELSKEQYSELIEQTYKFEIWYNEDLEEDVRINLPRSDKETI